MLKRACTWLKRVGVLYLAGSLAVIAPTPLDLFVPIPATAVQTGAAITVTTSADELINNGNCSLREAIQTINTHTPVDACGESDVQTITLPSGTYTLTLAGPNEDENAAGDLDIKSNVTIQGPGVEPPWIDGNQLDRIFQVHAGATVTITNVMVRNGRAPDGTSDACNGGDGGGIANAGILTLAGCAIADNQAGNGCVGEGEQGDGGDGGRGGGVFNLGTLTLESSTVRDNIAGAGGDSGEFGSAGAAGYGGGIYNAGNLTIKNSTIRGNRTAIGGRFIAPPNIACGSGGHGGGLYNAGRLTLDSSTVHDNQTANGDSCGGSHAMAGNGGYGGGIYTTDTLKVSNTTISGNRTGAGGETLVDSGEGGHGGGIYNTGVLTIDNGTLTHNRAGAGGGDDGLNSGQGGGIYNSVGTAQARNTILAGNMSVQTGPDCNGVLTSAGFNLIQSSSDCTIVGNATGNLVGIDPLLLPLADYGGPTWTHALLPGSQAVDTGSCAAIDGTVITVDQRNIGRPQGVTCDIGAYEAPVFPKVYLPVVLRVDLEQTRGRASELFHNPAGTGRLKK